MAKGIKIPSSWTCKKVKGKKLIMCSDKTKKPKKTKKTGESKRTGGLYPKSKRGPAMRAAKKRAAKVPGGRGPVAKRPAGRKILGS